MSRASLADFTLPIRSGFAVKSSGLATLAGGSIIVGTGFDEAVVDPGRPFALLIPPSSDSGSIGDFLTNVSRPLLTGRAVPGTTVAIFEDPSASGGLAAALGLVDIAGTVIVDESGAWSFQPTVPLADGLWTLTAASIDQAGQVGQQSDGLDLIIDTMPPTQPATPNFIRNEVAGGGSQADTNDNRPRLSGTAGPGELITLYERLSSSRDNLITASSVSQSGSWEIRTPEPLVDGRHHLYVTSTDAAGNVSAPSEALDLLVDTDSPSSPTLIVSNEIGRRVAEDSFISGSRIPTLIGLAESSCRITIYERSAFGARAIGVTDSGADGHWSFNVPTPLEDGLHYMWAEATDGYGNISLPSTTVTVEVAATPPHISERIPGRIGDLSQTGRVIRGQSEAGSIIKVLDIDQGESTLGQVACDQDGMWQFELDRSDLSRHLLVATTESRAGVVARTSPLLLENVARNFDLYVKAEQDGRILSGDEYAGPVEYLQHQFIYAETKDVVIGANVPSVFLHSGPGDDALAVTSGSNVLDGGTGSNWLVGASGLDGGHDTFFCDSQGATTWDTIVNFHSGDLLTVFGVSSDSSDISYFQQGGAVGYTGPTFHITNSQTSTSVSITFAGIDVQRSGFVTSFSTVGGAPYLAIELSSPVR